jgi:hypothetical protein
MPTSMYNSELATGLNAYAHSMYEYVERQMLLVLSESLITVIPMAHQQYRFISVLIPSLILS